LSHGKHDSTHFAEKVIVPESCEAVFKGSDYLATIDNYRQTIKNSRYDLLIVMRHYSCKKRLIRSNQTPEIFKT